MISLRRLVVLLSLLCLLPATPASAQWFAGVYLGANTTRPSDIALKGDGYDTVFPRIEFEAEPFTSPQYYGGRLGRFLSDTRRVGVEVEFIHLKVIAKPGQLGQDVQRYSMTHGLNYLLLNLVSRVPKGRSAYGDAPYAIVSRIGVGATIPHAETTILGIAQEQYEFGGLGAHASLGLDVRVRGRLSLLAEYKLTYSRPTIDTAHQGTGRITALSHHVAVGLAFGLSR